MTVTLLALVVIVASSVCWSGLDLMRKVLVERYSPLVLLFALTFGMLPFFVAWAAFDGPASLQPGYAAPALGSVLVNLVANYLFFVAVRVAPLSIIIPMLSFTPVITALLAIPLLGEYPGWMQLAGTALVVVGALLLHAGEKPSAAPDGPPSRPVWGSLLMLAVAFCWSASISFDKLAMERSSGPLHAIVLNLSISLVALIFLVVLGRQREIAELRRTPAAILGALVFGALALGLQLVAIGIALVSLVETLKRGIGNTLALILGRVIFGESITPLKVVAVLVMAAGVGLVVA